MLSVAAGLRVASGVLPAVLPTAQGRARPVPGLLARGQSAPPGRGGPLSPLLPWLAAACAGMARASQCRSASRIDSHLHIWSPDTENYPFDTPPPEHLNTDGRATSENFVKLMDEAEVDRAIIVQPINYGQDYRYLTAAMDAYGGRLLGVFVADPTVPAEEAAAWIQQRKESHAGWVGVRFNPYKWPESSSDGMADAVGKAMFAEAGRLGLVVGFMPFKGLSRHMVEIEALLESSPSTKVLIDHWGFFLQPATGHGDDRSIDEKSWEGLLKLASYPQVCVKLSALFRVAQDPFPFTSLSSRLEQLLKAFGSERLLWGSDFPYVTEHTEYGPATRVLEQWPAWEALGEDGRANILAGTASRLYGLEEA
mmetsp:Transcript_99028/g.288826  ORF Transcript_99028/g.288826 Transcript_99028/m.288826 type:complete len:367 (-) Transcript_99028:124-1224(-)